MRNPHRRTWRHWLVARPATVLTVSVGALLAACSQASAPPATPSEAATSAGESAAPSASNPDASESATAVGEPAVFEPETISTDAEEYRISFTPDGSTAYFARGDGFFPQSRRATIMESQLVDGAWSEPVVASFSGSYPDIDPWVSPDGESIYFSSIRPVNGEERPDAEVWRVDRDGEGWGEPVHIAAVGSDGDELGASVSADGLMWFASDRPGGAGGWDLYTSESSGGEFAEPVPAEEFNSAIWEFNPAIDAEGSRLLFTSIGRDGSSGLGDLYHATYDGDDWSAAQPVPINSSADEYHASLSPDGATLFFVKRLGQGDIYSVEWETGP